MKPHEILEAIPNNAKIVLDLTSWGVVVGALMDALPAVAAFLSIVWLLWQMVDRYRYGPQSKRVKTKGRKNETSDDGC